MDGLLDGLFESPMYTRRVIHEAIIYTNYVNLGVEALNSKGCGSSCNTDTLLFLLKRNKVNCKSGVFRIDTLCYFVKQMENGL